MSKTAQELESIVNDHHEMTHGLKAWSIDDQNIEGPEATGTSGAPRCYLRMSKRRIMGPIDDITIRDLIVADNVQDDPRTPVDGAWKEKVAAVSSDTVAVVFDVKEKKIEEM